MGKVALCVEVKHGPFHVFQIQIEQKFELNVQEHERHVSNSLRWVTAADAQAALLSNHKQGAAEEAMGRGIVWLQFICWWHDQATVGAMGCLTAEAEVLILNLALDLTEPSVFPSAHLLCS